VNGAFVATIGSTTDFLIADLADSILASFDITSFLFVGSSVIEVTGQNGI
jgi:hypothetical protein